MVRALRLACAALLLAACAAGPETRRLQAETQPVRLDGVPFFAQDDYQCGPAALATILAAAGIEASAEGLVDEVYLPARQGSLQPELLAALRRRGLVPYVLEPHIDAALAALHAGQPVLVLQNLGLATLPVWHYAVVIGYEPRAGVFTLRSGREPALRMRRTRFLETWDRGGRWMLVAASADAPPPYATPDGWLRAAAPFESLNRLDVAERAYLAATRRWPDAPLAWAALGNLHARREAPRAAIDAYRRALALDARAPLVRNNYAWTLAQAGCRDAALQEIALALDDADTDARTLIERTRVQIEAQSASARCPW